MRRLLGQGEMHYSCVRPRVVGGVAPSIPRVVMQTHWADVACVIAQQAPSEPEVPSLGGAGALALGAASGICGRRFSGGIRKKPAAPQCRRVPLAT